MRSGRRASGVSATRRRCSWATSRRSRSRRVVARSRGRTPRSSRRWSAASGRSWRFGWLACCAAAPPPIAPARRIGRCSTTRGRCCCACGMGRRPAATCTARSRTSPSSARRPATSARTKHLSRHPRLARLAATMRRNRSPPVPGQAQARTLTMRRNYETKPTSRPPRRPQPPRKSHSKPRIESKSRPRATRRNYETKPTSRRPRRPQRLASSLVGRVYRRSR